MPEPRPLSKDMLARAYERADHYRLLNEPAQAESICRDILAVEPENEKAWVQLLLSLTDQFPDEMSQALEAANEALGNLKNEYHRAYYQGIIHERWGRANLNLGRGQQAAQSWIRQAMQSYQKAMELAPSDDPDPTLRWNTCARLLEKSTQSATKYAAGSSRDIQSEYDEVPRRN
ncbi:MAG: hypothetical protein HKN47_22215 [Pirellulaceae bacterium]|nr:hypothetical protein [Pirellulaceae bacterium]